MKKDNINTACISCVERFKCDKTIKIGKNICKKNTLNLRKTNNNNHIESYILMNYKM